MKATPDRLITGVALALLAPASVAAQEAPLSLIHI